MKTETYFQAEGVLLHPRAQHTLAAIGVSSLIMVWLYWNTVWSTISIWQRSQTFTHCFVIVPVILWLVWRQRQELRAVPLQPWPAVLPAMAAAGAAWLAGVSADVLGVSQLAVLVMLELSIVALIGLPAARQLAFPLAFAFFAVPMGEALVPPMIEWTANFTVAALKLSAVPVYREGNTFIIPSGRWSVVEACSGIRYVLASVMGGTLFAYLFFRSTKRRVLFVLASAIVPIIANWLRAYFIVMLGHLSDNALAVGIDHLFYGWLMFGIIMGALFWIGSYWREDTPQTQARQLVAPPGPPFMVSDMRTLWGVTLAAVALATPWPLLVATLDRGVSHAAVDLSPLSGGGKWTLSADPISDWQPRFSGASATLHQVFSSEGRAVGLFIAYYRTQSQGRELIHSGNVLTDDTHTSWIQTASATATLPWDGNPTTVRAAEVWNGTLRLDLRYWYWVNGGLTTSPVRAKLLLAQSKLTGQGDDSALVLVYARKPDFGTASDATLRDFASQLSPAVNRMLEQARDLGR